MALITRITRLFKADMHAIIDTIEEPASLLKQSIREMEDLIIEDNKNLLRLSGQCQWLSDDLIELDRLSKQDEEKLDLCFDDNNDSLARSIIKQQLERAQYKKNQSDKLTELERVVSELETRISDNKMLLESMKQKAELLIQDTSNISQSTKSSSLDINISQDDIEVAFIREKKKRSSS